MPSHCCFFLVKRRSLFPFAWLYFICSFTYRILLKVYDVSQFVCFEMKYTCGLNPSETSCYFLTALLQLWQTIIFMDNFLLFLYLYYIIYIQEYMCVYIHICNILSISYLILLDPYIFFIFSSGNSHFYSDFCIIFIFLHVLLFAISCK